MHSGNTCECPLSSCRTLNSWRSLSLLQNLSKVVYVMTLDSQRSLWSCADVFSSCVMAQEQGDEGMCVIHAKVALRSRTALTWPILEKFIGDEEIGSENQIAFLILPFLFSRPRNVSVPALCLVTENLAGCFWSGC